MNRIKELREKRKIEQKELAIDLGVSQPTISAWEREIKQPSSSSAKKLADYFGVSMDYLLGRSLDKALSSDSSNEMKKYRRIPVLGEVPAGVPIEAIEDIVDWEDIDDDGFPPWFEYIGLQVKGDSMMPEYHDGDVLIVKLQDTAETGDDAVVFVNGEDATFKRILRRKDGIMLRPLNPDYEPLYFTNKEIVELPIKIMGVAVEFRRRLK